MEATSPRKKRLLHEQGMGRPEPSLWLGSVINAGMKGSRCHVPSWEVLTCVLPTAIPTTDEHRELSGSVQRTTCRGQFSPTVCAPGPELDLSYLATSAFTC